ncbi:MAG: efflux RND transporter periplasmic adaptor subunit [Pseudomonadota bacterium]
MIRQSALFLVCVFWPVVGFAQAISAVLEPVQLVEIKSSVAGRLQEIAVSEGQDVVEGTLLASIDARVQQARLRLAQTAAEATGSEERAAIVIEQAQNLYKRVEIARKKGAAQAWEIDQSEQAVKLAEADQKIAKETADQLKQQYELELATLAEFSMRAPFDGTVLQVMVEKGEIIETQVTVLEFGNLDRLKATAFVPIDWLADVAIGQSLQASVGLDETQVEIKIVSIDPRVDPASQSVRVRFELENPDRTLIVGTSVQIERP